MREIESILQSCWSSLNHGVDIVKASKALYIRHIEEVAKITEKLVNSYTQQLLEKESLIDSFEEDMEASNKLLMEALPELKKYKDIHSNAPTIHGRLEHLISRIEEQIKKNGE